MRQDVKSHLNGPGWEKLQKNELPDDAELPQKTCTPGVASQFHCNKHIKH
ncbi:hypothetical protein Fmac_014284 [Flemingia macrophylla]|uniref:Uncharacterized protein n=1 Tax=Flemingia macrophylla TaxID=520843 RepID=A0ABD1MBA0_9FABA